MRKTLFGALVLGALMFAAAMTPEAVVAQVKKVDKTTKKDDKPAKDKSTKGVKAGVIEIAQGKDEKFRFFVRDGEGKLLAMSGPGGFGTAKEAEAAIEKLREVVARAKVTSKPKGDK